MHQRDAHLFNTKVYWEQVDCGRTHLQAEMEQINPWVGTHV